MKGNAAQTKVHLKGKTEDFVIFVESKEAVQNWKNDKSVPLAQVVDAYKVFVTHKHGTQGIMDTASKGTLEDEFGTSRDDDVVKQMLERGTITESENPGRQGQKNETNGPRQAH
ncbi:hypothetical protein LTR37_016600 [Vermiconidia calcicola]|uniref:Uncharacterized protein n=2 Tax=Vermiconidia calcicola TaxID=1690605 RepID=A0ACC3MCT8_9PEZI|nr:hypothetical protein LTR37_020412 [Vermiconidia calcicola]KAK3699126.1 hypothetical protein LTR37_016600 [Vermiconidia calcicola]